MCGIAGYFVTHPSRVRAVALQKLCRELLLEIESRGRHATGFAFVSSKTNNIILAKAPVPASKFIETPGHLLAGNVTPRSMPQSLVLHTRFATTGKPED